MKFVATKKGMTTNFFFGMGKNQDPGSGINIPDPQQWIQVYYYTSPVWGCHLPYPVLDSWMYNWTQYRMTAVTRVGTRQYSSLTISL